ncbi:class I SAM-dependent methyltransferase [Methylibium sp.]|uniref:class I SAM-dependent methyltransferase n=1 Tax=Methylibium sp. TaxID=2067992 RepID=UPI0033401443
MSRPVEDDDEARAVAERYARRDPRADARRYGLFDAASLQAQQERLRAMVALWRAHGWADLTGRDLLEVGCGAGGNLLDLLRLGAEPGRLAGIELQADRATVARRLLPPAVRLIEGDATIADVAPASQDAVLAFTVFSSVLDDAAQIRLAHAMWHWVRPGGGVLCYDFAVDNPYNPDVRGVPVARLRALFPQARAEVRRVTLAPPVARAVARLNPRLPAWLNALAPLRTHRLCWLEKL